MTRIGDWRGVVLCGLATCSFGALAQEQKWGAHIDFEAKPGSKRTLGEADLFLPLAQDARTLYFANLRGRFADHGSREGNFGLGVRHMLESGWNLGAYGYLDRRRSDTGNHFNQATLGAEALGRDWDFRANGYLPLGTKAHDLGSASTAAISGAAIQVTTTAREERALKGFDAEMGWRAPLFDSEAVRQLRLYAGGYRFADAGVKVQGPRLRAELTMDELPWFGKGAKLFLGAEAQDDSARGGQTFLSLRLRIPLGKESSHPSTLNAQERRMTAPVMRDVDIVTQSRVSSTLVENAAQTAGGSAITVLDSATTTGAALPGAVTAAGANTVILSGTFNTTAATTLQAGQTLMGAGTFNVVTPSGRIVTLVTPSATIAANVSGGAGGSAIGMSNNSTLSGMTITNTRTAGTGAIGVIVSGATGVTIANNNISVSETGANTAMGISITGASTVTLSGNTVSATTTGGNTATAFLLNGGGATVTVTGNTFGGYGGNTTRALYRNNGTIDTAASTGNVLLNGGCFAPGGSGSIGFTNGTTCP